MVELRASIVWVLGSRGGGGARRSTRSRALQVVRINFHQRRRGSCLNLRCLAESAVNLRTSWVSSAERELASKLHSTWKVLVPCGGSMRPYLVLMAAVLMAVAAFGQR